MKSENTRSSNFELLRIFAMFGIVLHHLMVNDLDVLGYNTAAYSSDLGGAIYPILNSIAACGVDLFLLITGWFGVKHVIKKLVSLLLLCVMIGVLCMGVAFLSPVYEFSMRNNILTITSLHSWFIKFYLCLLVISPLLEWVIGRMNRKQLLFFFILLTFLNIGGCWGLELVHDNATGYSVINFIYLYFMGRTLREFKESNFMIAATKYSLPIFIILAIFAGLLFDHITMNGYVIESEKYWAYNGIVILPIVFFIFVTFMKKKIQSEGINKIAACTLIVYLAHSNLVMGYYRNIFTDYMTSIFGMLIGLFVAAIVVYSLGTMVGYVIVKIQKPLLAIIFKQQNKK